MSAAGMSSGREIALIAVLGAAIAVVTKIFG